MKHLIEPLQKIALKADAERIASINGARWIKYPAAEKILIQLEDLLLHPKILRMPNLLIVGDSNNGKTVLVDHFCGLHKPFITIEDEKVNVPVIYTIAPQQPDEKLLFKNILVALNAPFRINDTFERRERQVYSVLRHVGTKMLIIDEIHSVLSGNTSKHRIFMNVLKNLTNELQIVIVVSGVREALNAVNTDSQIANRFRPVFLPKWQYNEEFVRLLASFEKLIPIRQPSNLGGEELSSKIYDLSEGTIGEINRVITLSAIDAIRTKKEVIDMEILKNINYVRPSASRSLAGKLI